MPTPAMWAAFAVFMIAVLVLAVRLPHDLD